MPDADQDKPYKLSFADRPGYLYAYVEGDHDSYDISRAFWLEIAGESARRGATKILIDENIEEGASVAEVFRLATEIPLMGFGAARIAFVDRYLDQTDINEFGELVAVNRGLNGKLFNDERAAEVWLLADHGDH